VRAVPTDTAEDEAAPGSNRSARRAASSTVAAILREAIIDGELLPGEQVRQQEWAERAGVSRPPIREALEVLASEGLLQHSLNRGYFVSRISLHEMHQLYLMRRLLERETALRVVWPSEAQMAELVDMTARARAAGDRGDRDRQRESVEQFLVAVHRLSPDQLIVQAVLDLWTRTSAYRALSFSTVQESQLREGVLDAVLQALRDEDHAALCDALLRPTVASHDFIERELSRSGVDNR
jgi:DNA-binding GntR family transcriptional regulator